MADSGGTGSQEKGTYSRTELGMVARGDSDSLKMVQVALNVNVNLIVPSGSGRSGYFKSRIEHISELEKTRFYGHLAVGISFHVKIPFYGD